jgi:hypothetical protein
MSLILIGVGFLVVCLVAFALLALYDNDRGPSPAARTTLGCACGRWAVGTREIRVGGMWHSRRVCQPDQEHIR